MNQVTQITKTAALAYPGCAERLRKEGFPAIARMAELLPSPKAMDEALGFSGAASHWLAGRNGVSKIAERSAMLWLETYNKPGSVIVTKAQPQPDETAVLMVICPRGKADKAMKVLGLMGCEVEEI